MAISENGKPGDNNKNVCTCGADYGSHYSTSSPHKHFVLDVGKSPPLAPNDLVRLADCIDRDFCPLDEGDNAEHTVEKIAMKLYGCSIEELRRLG